MKEIKGQAVGKSAPKDQFAGKTLVGFVSSGELAALFSDSFRVYSTPSAVKRRKRDCVYEVRVKVEGKA